VLAFFQQWVMTELETASLFFPKCFPELSFQEKKNAFDKHSYIIPELYHRVFARIRVSYVTVEHEFGLGY
jgi:hypothetical protein